MPDETLEIQASGLANAVRDQLLDVVKKVAKDTEIVVEGHVVIKATDKSSGENVFFVRYPINMKIEDVG